MWLAGDSGFGRVLKFAAFIVAVGCLIGNDGVQSSVLPHLNELGGSASDFTHDRNKIPLRYASALLGKTKRHIPLSVNEVFSEPAQVSAKDDRPAEVAEKRKFIRTMMKNAWDGYVQYAWGWGRVAPHSKQPSDIGVFGGHTKLGVTIIDSLDSLWIMGLRKEFHHASDWVKANLTFDTVLFSAAIKHQDAEVSVFEVNISLLGGLLSAFGLSNDAKLKEKAYELGNLLLPAFDATSTGIPYALYNWKTKTGEFYSWVPGGSAVLAEIGSLHMEFAYLSNITNDPSFINKVLRVREVLDKAEKRNGLYSNFINPDSGKFASKWSVSVGGLGDSFYEYLLKSWLLSNRTDSTAKRMFDEAITAIDSQLVRTSVDGHVYFIKLDGSTEVHEMEHLACFIGGLYGLGAPYAANPDNFTLRGGQIAETCHATYAMTQTKIGPESFSFSPGESGIDIGNAAYYLRPEVIETWFVMWRRTRDPKYRQWGWDAAQAIEKYCRAEAGYAGVRDVNDIDPTTTDNQDDAQYSYFLAEVLKYLYLMFVDEKPDGTSTAEDDGGIDISLEEFVFNTEAHPLPIFGTDN